ncbi:MAG: DUF3179 domain-containing protein [gamma proteobacterium symbiont of Bathyaustriella thionipta]|nr:DUF3179 domain-containing protein [gamma proteobacterium symbiont of Bathyaustriella thionipta]
MLIYWRLRKKRYFPVTASSTRYHPKERVIGVEIDGHYKAYPFAELPAGKGRLMDHFSGRILTIDYDSEALRATVSDKNGEIMPVINAFWFAWYGFHPQTLVYSAAAVPVHE